MYKVFCVCKIVFLFQYCYKILQFIISINTVLNINNEFGINGIHTSVKERAVRMNIDFIKFMNADWKQVLSDKWKNISPVSKKSFFGFSE